MFPDRSAKLYPLRLPGRIEASRETLSNSGNNSGLVEEKTGRYEGREEVSTTRSVVKLMCKTCV